MVAPAPLPAVSLDELLAHAMELRAEEEAAAEVELLARRPAQIGPTEWEREIFEAIYIHGRPEHQLAPLHGRAPRTLRNIARTTMRRLARQQTVWDRMTLRALVAEEERLDGLMRQATEAWHTLRVPWTEVPGARNRRGRRTTTTTRLRYGDVRYLEVARRLLGQLLALGTQIRVRAEEYAAPSRTTRTVPRRTRRRKSLGGRGLRLPCFVRTPRVSVEALARRVRTGSHRAYAATLRRGLRRIGIPPPAT